MIPGRGDVLRPDPAEAALEERLRVGDVGGAIGVAVSLLRRAPRHAGAWRALARLMLHSGDAERAYEAASNATRVAPDDADAWYLLGRACKARGDVRSAIAGYERALTIEPDSVAVLTSLGIAQRAVGESQAARRTYERALVLQPDSPELRRNLANVLRDLGDVERAAALDEQVGGAFIARLAGIDAEIDAAVARGDLDRAHALAEEAVRLAADDSAMWYRAGTLAQRRGAYERAIECYVRAAELDATNVAALDAASALCAAAGELDRARELGARADSVAPSAGRRLRLALLLPSVLPSSAAIDEIRGQFERALDVALQSTEREDDPAGTIGVIGFLLAYHGRNDRALQVKLASALAHVAPSLVASPQRPVRRHARARRRIGIASAHLYEHSIGRTSRGIFAEVSRTRAELVAVNFGTPPDDAISRRIRADADEYVVVERDLRRAREQIAALDLDVLFYQDVGIEPMSYYLAHSRLAPVQCTSFGHPETSGIPSLDWYVSSADYEPDDAQDHYREALFLLRDVPVIAYYYRPVRPPGGPGRRDFGFGEREHIYLCPQALFKVHPDFDAIVAAILRDDPSGRVVFVDGYVPGRSSLLQRRFRESAPDVADRVAFIPPVGGAQFLDLLAAADVMLDTPHFNGFNTTLEAFSVGTPVVTLPGQFQRGRHTQAMCRAMGLEELIASDATAYARLAVAIATNARRRVELSDAIARRSARLFEDRRFIEELERFFDAVCD